MQLCSVGKDHAVVGKLTAAGDLELGQQVADVQVLFLFPGHVVDDVALIHHDQAAAALDGILMLWVIIAWLMVFLHDLSGRGSAP